MASEASIIDIPIDEDGHYSTQLRLMDPGASRSTSWVRRRSASISDCCACLPGMATSYLKGRI
jgi:hypothetical protein